MRRIRRRNISPGSRAKLERVGFGWLNELHFVLGTFRGNNCDNRAALCDNVSIQSIWEVPMPERINARLSQPLAEFVDRMVGEAGLYETPSEYVRDLIRRDMERR